MPVPPGFAIILHVFLVHHTCIASIIVLQYPTKVDTFLKEVTSPSLTSHALAIMLSSLGAAAEEAHCQECPQNCRKQIDNQQLLSHFCVTFCPIAQSMTYIAGALTSSALISKPASAHSVHSENPSQSISPSMREDPILEEPVEDACPDSRSQTRSTASSDPKSQRSSRSNSCVKTKTAFRLAHPPPVIVHKHRFSIRPRVLLQLQQISTTSRPRPILEVLPSVIFAPRLARRFPRTFKGKAGLGADDLVVVSSENYDTNDPDARGSDDFFEDDRWDKREIVAAICQPSRDGIWAPGSAEICLNYGSSWIASPLANGIYEFISTDEFGHQLIARWVPKQPRGQWTSSARSSPTMSEEKKFTFSLLNSGSRRHAIISTLDARSIEVSDRYCNPPPSLDAQTSPTSTAPPAIAPSDFSTQSTEANIIAKQLTEVDESLRTLIIITGIWVAFREGFSPNFMYSDVTRRPPSTPRSSGQKQRNLSVDITNSRNTSPESPSFGSQHRPRARIQHTSSSSIVPSSTYSSSLLSTPPRRTMSTGAAFMQRVNTRNFARNSQQLSPIGDFDRGNSDKGAGKQGKGQSTQESEPAFSSNNSPSPRRSMSFRHGHGTSLSPVVTTGRVSPTDSATVSVETPKRSRTLKELFGFGRRAGAFS